MLLSLGETENNAGAFKKQTSQTACLGLAYVIATP